MGDVTVQLIGDRQCVAWSADWRVIFKAARASLIVSEESLCALFCEPCEIRYDRRDRIRAVFFRGDGDRQGPAVPRDLAKRRTPVPCQKMSLTPLDDREMRLSAARLSALVGDWILQHCSRCLAAARPNAICPQLASMSTKLARETGRAQGQARHSSRVRSYAWR